MVGFETGAMSTDAEDGPPEWWLNVLTEDNPFIIGDWDCMRFGTDRPMHIIDETGSTTCCGAYSAWGTDTELDEAGDPDFFVITAKRFDTVEHWCQDCLNAAFDD